ncbi:MAG: hypothetical protein M3336_05285 [Chloroflexota bacterium]|nr:hypothetical protein [Chloroflexota bacterium]
MTTHHGDDQSSPGALAAGAPGSQLWVPAAEKDDTTMSASATGGLGTSGREDQERGDTVSGLGLQDVNSGQESSTRRSAVEPGPQSGEPTPGNRYAEDELERETST